MIEHLTPQTVLPALPSIPIGAVIWWIINKLLKLEKEMHKRTSKDYADETFQRKDLCIQNVTEIKGDVKEIKLDVKELLRRNGKQQ